MTQPRAWAERRTKAETTDPPDTVCQPSPAFLWTAPMRAERLAKFLPFVIGVLLITACDRGPRTFEECMVDLGRTQTSQEAQRTCMIAFPPPPPAPSSGPASAPTPARDPLTLTRTFWGTWYYVAEGDTCASMRFEVDASVSRVSPYSPGFCGLGSRIECDPARGCSLVCVGRRQGDGTQLFWLDSDTADVGGRRILAYPRGGSRPDISPVEGQTPEFSTLHMMNRILGAVRLYERQSDCEEFRLNIVP